MSTYSKPESIANWVINELLRELKGQDIDSFSVRPDDFAGLVRLVDEDVISARIAKDVFEEMVASGRSASSIVEEKGLEQVADPDAIEPVVEDVLSTYPEKVTEYQSGKKGLIGFFIGQVMKRTGGKAKPDLVRNLLEERLKG